MSLVKICGLQSAEAAVAAARLGADYLGFIFAPSRRQVGAADVAAIRRSVRSAGFATPLVGVFVDPDPGEMSATAEVSGIDLVQLSGDEDPASFAKVGLPIIKGIPAGATETAEAIAAQIDTWSFARHILVDASDPNARGGTGKLANWELAREVTGRHSVLLAGGLTPHNVKDALAVVRPAGVDVSSGVEREGVKDVALIERFLAAAHR